jgi:dipeptidyl aminopeptidase/acylaminoacyl peptidase
MPVLSRIRSMGRAAAPHRAFAMACTIAGALGLAMAGQGAAPPSIEDFAGRPRIESVSISPDGRYLALIETRAGKGFVLVYDRTAVAGAAPKPVFKEPDHFYLSWCRWATDARLLCGLRGMANDSGLAYSVSRLLAVDADGKHLKVLVQSNPDAQGQYQDRIINWNPGAPNTVLIEADEGIGQGAAQGWGSVYGSVGTYGLPAVFELDVNNGRMSMRQPAYAPIRDWATDLQGQVRLGWGYEGTAISYFARLAGKRELHRLSKFEAFSRESHFKPIAISAQNANKAYAYGEYEGRNALWLIDLTEHEDPTPVFVHPSVDVGAPILAPDGRLLGVEYATDRPMIYYTDPRAEATVASIQRLFPGKFVSIAGSTRDEKVLLIESYSDIEPSSFTLLDTTTSKASALGKAYPDRDESALAPMRSIFYAARDGTRIPGYLSVPVGAADRQLPLIVMPHGGPIARDDWEYFFLREFLVSRGYAVLQMNFRGSSGYGSQWFFAAHQDWGGLTYDDIVDATRWAVAQGIADPKRICIVGWSFGGYAALLGAQRNADLFRCSVDIAGVSDLGLLLDEGHAYINAEIQRRQIGTDSAKLKRDSPRRHAEEFTVPVLLLHGTMDGQVPIEQSEAMDSALTRAGKAHRLVRVRDADHSFSEMSDKVTMMQEIERFLAQYLPRSAITPVTPP